MTPEGAGWGYVGFGAYELEEGQQLMPPAVSEERCLVLIAGRTTITTPGATSTDTGEQMSPFERIRPQTIYVATGETIQVQAVARLESAVCAAPRKDTYPTRLIAPKDVNGEARGKDHNQRYVHNTLPEDKPADNLLVVGMRANEGCTSSYPSHKHDTDNPPQKTYLEETYYHRLNPPQGFCMRRVYTGGQSLGECVVVYSRGMVMVPKGYHSVATLAGHDSYYLNMMAGPVRKWISTWGDEYAWVNRDYPVDK